MDRDEYEGKEAEYQAKLAEAYKALEEKSSEKARRDAQEEELRKSKTEHNLRMKQRIFGSSKNESANVQEAELQRKKIIEELARGDLEKEKARIAKQSEINIFGSNWARLNARQAAYGETDPEVQHLRQQKEKEEQQYKIEREKYLRPDFDRPHAIDRAKGETKAEYNRSAEPEL